MRILILGVQNKISCVVLYERCEWLYGINMLGRERARASSLFQLNFTKSVNSQYGLVLSAYQVFIGGYVYRQNAGSWSQRRDKTRTSIG